jgi:enoyl-CoA hydratase/carnithine racemase
MSPALTYLPGAPVGQIILSQPLKRNAISAAMWTALADAVAAAEQDEGAALVVIRGDGGHFASGADITEFAKVYETPQSAEQYTRVMLAGLSALENCRRPTLAAIRGACVGGGCSIALACDFRFASDNATFAITPARLGLVYSLADTRRLVGAVGAAAAKEMLFTGRTLTASEAAAIGLVSHCFADDALDEAVKAFAEALAPTSRFSIDQTKKMMSLLEQGAGDDDARAMALLVQSFSGADFAEGFRAFLDKRKPRFPTR